MANQDPPTSATATSARNNGQANHLAKRILILCWFVSVCHIWLADSFFDIADYDSLIDEQLRSEKDAPPVDRRRQRRRDVDDPDQGSSDLERGSQLLKSTTDDGTGATASLTIPEALQPITYNECCVPAIYANYGRPNDMKCFGTCYNERACHDPSYPYANMLERKKYGHLKKLVGDERKLLRERCVFKPEYLVPNVTWCSKRADSENNAFGGVPRPGCSLVTNGGGSGPWQNVFIFPQAKLAFCGIPKGLFL